jgi:hypothetical protein
MLSLSSYLGRPSFNVDAKRSQYTMKKMVRHV